MAQHDLNIANQLFPATRQDLNNVIAALASNNSGGTAPTVTLPGMMWYDTANQIIKIRNNANTAWVSVFNVATASAFAPGPPGPKGDKGDPGVSPVLPDFSWFMTRSGGSFVGEIAGPTARFNSFVGGGGSNDFWNVVNIGQSVNIVQRALGQYPQVTFNAMGWQAGSIFSDIVTGDFASLGSIVVAARNGPTQGFTTWAFNPNGNVYAQGGFVGTHFTVSSDREYKENVRDLGYVGDDLIKLRVKEYTRKENGKWQVGLVAQELVEDVGRRWPGLVERLPNGTLAIDQSSLIGLMLKWLQELHVRVPA